MEKYSIKNPLFLLRHNGFNKNFHEITRLAATVVFPVPPFPLAMATIMFSPPFEKSEF